MGAAKPSRGLSAQDRCLRTGVARARIWQDSWALVAAVAKSPDDKVLLLIDRLARLMRAADHYGGLNPAQWEALRYLSRCNRFSNSPGALTRYLSATKGTVSQTVIALERKGLIEKSPRPEERRSVSLQLTAAGQRKLQTDPRLKTLESVAAMSGKSLRRLTKGLSELLDSELRRGYGATFGVCRTCRFFREKGAEDKKEGPHFCLLLNVPLSKQDSRTICVEHERP